MNVILPSKTIFYAIERAIKSYRKFAQKNISNSIDNISIDQGLVLLFLDKYPELTQKEIADLVFKDNASMTRMINLMVAKKYLKRSMNDDDLRRYKLSITETGREILEKLPSIISNNRRKALKDISKEELIQLNKTLNKIIANCT